MILCGGSRGPRRRGRGSRRRIEGSANARHARSSRQQPNASGAVFCRDGLLGSCTWTFSPSHRVVVTTYALTVAAAGEGDNRYQAFAPSQAASHRIPVLLPLFSSITG